MRISWATDSSQMLASPLPRSNAKRHADQGFSAPKKLTKPGRAPKRARTRSRISKHESVMHAKKREKVKANVAKKDGTEATKPAYSFVYVGNLESSITKERLESLFAPYGSISRIQFRCSRGQAVTVGVAVPEGVRTSRDRQYATIEFNDDKAARNALRLNGKLLDGCQLVVTISPADLPEVQDIIQTRLGNFRERRGQQTKPSSRGIQNKDTEVFTEAKADQHRLFGISFAMCVA